MYWQRYRAKQQCTTRSAQSPQSKTGLHGSVYIFVCLKYFLSRVPTVTMVNQKWNVPVVSIVVPFWVYLYRILIIYWLNQKRNYNGDYRYIEEYRVVFCFFMHAGCAVALGVPVSSMFKP